MSDFIVGLTGGISCGKTTVAEQFERLGVDLVDADVIAREVVQPGSECLNAIVAQFGEGILLADGNLNREQLRALIFSDPDKKQWLDNLMHPAIRTEIEKQLKAATSDYCMLVAPLLFENKLERYCNLILVADVPEHIQIQRTCARDGVSVEQVESIIKSQVSRTERLNKADHIIDNLLPKIQVEQQIPRLHAKYVDFSKKHT